MSSPADTQSRPLKRHRRKTKTTSVSQSQSNDLSDEAAPRQIESDLDAPQQDSGPTPPNMFRPVSNGHAPDQPNSTAGGTRGAKRTPRKSQGARPNGTSPMAKMNSTPRDIHRTISLTPGKKSTTPSQAYAGPTFHASPAASSLPMPRFFSKSVPEVNKGHSLQSSIEKEMTETSSEQSEGSPTPAFARRTGEEQAREESPLDIFFKADREQKERLRKEQEASLTMEKRPWGISNVNRPRCPSRHSTSGSTGGVFPMELESKEYPQATPEKSFSEPVNEVVVTDASKSLLVVETPQQAEQRKAKTIALKKLLLSSVPASDPILDPGETSSSNDTRTEGKSGAQQPRHSTSPQIYKQLAAQIARETSPCLRPSSNLRKEMSASALPDIGPMPELPATPTPSRTRHAYKSAPLQGEAATSLDRASPASSVAASSKRSTPASVTLEDSSPYKTMEDDLRRILKLNVLSSDGATGVRS
ncbi:MAG: hypothetical protein LQ345_006220 [Seirophora villosa]|nr:MAG: hypothetical protein LQ345_006220 [Seirophora villosa]